MSRFEAWVVLVFGGVLLVLFVAVVIMCVVQGQAAARAENYCVEAGYAEALQWRAKYYCIGYNSDGKVQLIEAERLN